MDYSEILEQMKGLVHKADGEEECEYCHGSGWIVTSVDENGVEFYGDCPYCQKHQKNMRNLKLKFANIPEIYVDNRINDFDTNAYSRAEDKNIAKDVLKITKYWLETLDTQLAQGRGLYFCSENKGSGKTFLMAALANELMEQGHEVKFATSIDIINAIKDTWDRKNSPQHTESESDLITQLIDCEILIIDDFGTEKVKDWVSERFYSIINGRYSQGKVTCYTSNMALNDLEYDERILSRIKATVYMLLFPREDLRIKIGRKNHTNLKNAQN